MFLSKIIKNVTLKHHRVLINKRFQSNTAVDIEKLEKESNDAEGNYFYWLRYINRNLNY